jgi:hypothetical protein
MRRCAMVGAARRWEPCSAEMPEGRSRRCMLALLVRRPAGRRIQPRVRRAARGTARPARAEPLSAEDPPPLQSEVGRIMVAAAGQRRRGAALQPGQHARHLLTRLRHGTAVLSWRGCSRRARTAAEAVASPRPEQPRPPHPEDRQPHPPRQATPAGRGQPAHEQVICAVGTANTYRMSRHSYSAGRVWIVLLARLPR